MGKRRVWRRSKDKEHRPPTGSEVTVEMIFLGELLGTKDAFPDHHLFMSVARILALRRGYVSSSSCGRFGLQDGGKEI